MFALAAAVAVELGQGWSAGPGWFDDQIDARVNHIDGRVVHLEHDGHRGRVRAGAVCPAGLDRPEQRGWFVITVAATRPPRQVAAEIRRRLLPDYDPAYAQLRSADHDQQQRRARRDRLQRELVEALGGDPERVENVPVSYRLGEVRVGGRDTAEEHGADTELYVPFPGEDGSCEPVRLTLWLPADLAVQMCAAVTDLRARRVSVPLRRPE